MPKRRKEDPLTPEDLAAGIQRHEIQQEALRVELRTKILAALTALLPKASTEAARGKPALMRLIVRHCLRGGVLDVNPSGTHVPHVAIDRREHRILRADRAASRSRRTSPQRPQAKPPKSIQ